MLWTLTVPARPVRPVEPTLAALPSPEDEIYAGVAAANEAALAAYQTAENAWHAAVAVIDAIERQPVKAVHEVVDIGGGQFRADVDLDIAGTVERCAYVYRPGSPDASAAHTQLASLHTDGVFAGHIAVPAGPTTVDLVAYAATKRWEKASGGVSVVLPGGGAMMLPSDDVAYGRLKGASQDIAAGIISEPITVVIGSSVIEATGSLVTALYATISHHWQSCYATQGQVVAAILAGTITAKNQIDTAFA